VFPIPPGVHWHDAMPKVLPEERVSGVGSRVSGEDNKRLPGSSRNPKPDTRNPSPPTLGRLVFARPAEKKAAKPKREKKPKLKNDPRLVAAARELRDRWLEQINADPSGLLSAGKYNVSRALPADAAPMRTTLRLPPPQAAA
jgi:hypothetical protein